MKRLSCWAGIAFALVLLPVDVSRAADEEDPIDQAVKNGVEFLKRIQKDDGTWNHSEIGATALAGLALLECDVAQEDESIRKAASAVREASVTLGHTYSLALSIMFLDRLGDPADAPLIESMTFRLLAGQNTNGGWTYHCPEISDKEQHRLSTLLKQRNVLVAGELPKPEADKPQQSSRRMVSKEIQDQLKMLSKQKPREGGDDNSNTQFAILALWVSRRHGMPVEPALAKLDDRFRKSQNADGGWGYNFSGPSRRNMDNSTDSMTCAGLLGLAVSHGARVVLRTDPSLAPKNAPKEKDAVQDPAVRAGLLALGTAIGNPENPPMRGKGKGMKRGKRGKFGIADYYFLWSLERVAVVYGLQTIGNKDWYNWGAERLLDSQDQDGGWSRGGWSNADDGVNTSFALLFLRRANLAKDLTATLKGKVQDPGEVTLKAGGVGGEGLKALVSLKRGDNPHEKQPESSVSPEPKATESVTRPDNDKAKASATSVNPEPATPGGAVRLADELAKATVDRQRELIDRFKITPGGEYTEALASAIPRLTGDAKTQARDALAERLVRMTAKTLRTKLQDADGEMRSAAALACGMKEDREHVPDLLALLEDSDRRAARAAQVALKSLTGKDFGPGTDPTAAQKAEAVRAWKEWWAKQGERK